jgi:hypothetical protein
MGILDTAARDQIADPCPREQNRRTRLSSIDLRIPPSLSSTPSPGNKIMIVQSLKSRFTIVGVRAKRLANAIDICGQDRGNVGAAECGQSE